MANRFDFIINNRTHTQEVFPGTEVQHGYVVVMPKWQFNHMTGPINWHPHKTGGYDHDEAAHLSGHRIFVFATEDWLERHPGLTRFVVGLVSDFEAMKSSRRYSFDEVGDNLHDPVRNIRDEWEAKRLIATVTRGEFHAAFGTDAWTTKFPRS